MLPYDKKESNVFLYYESKKVLGNSNPSDWKHSQNTLYSIYSYIIYIYLYYTYIKRIIKKAIDNLFFIVYNYSIR